MRTVKAIKTLRFFNPLGGKPTPVQLSGIFLIAPATILKLYGLSFRRLFSESGAEALYKKCERVSQGKQPARPDVCAELLRKIPADSAIGVLLQGALDGDEDAKNEMERIGLWESFLLGIGYNWENAGVRGRLILSLERACAGPAKLIARGDLQSATQSLCADPVISLFLWPQAVELLNRCHSASQLLPLQAAISLEVQLSFLAAADVDIDGRESSFSSLLPNAQAPGHNPTTLFFEYLKTTIGIKSMNALLEHKKATNLQLDMATLKRWSAGSHHPDPAWLRPLVKAFFDDADFPPAWNRYWAAKNLNLIGYLAQTLSRRAHRLIGTAQENCLLPWPSYPFGFSGFEDWVEVRYPFWLSYHQKSKEGYLKDGEEKQVLSPS